MTRPAPTNAMRFSLRTLLIVLIVAPPLLWWMWARGREFLGVALMLAFVLAFTFVIAWVEDMRQDDE